jgi:hypothetical protein
MALRSRDEASRRCKGPRPPLQRATRSAVDQHELCAVGRTVGGRRVTGHSATFRTVSVARHPSLWPSHGISNSPLALLPCLYAVRMTGRCCSSGRRRLRSTRRSALPLCLAPTSWQCCERSMTWRRPSRSSSSSGSLRTPSTSTLSAMWLRRSRARQALCSERWRARYASCAAAWRCIRHVRDALSVSQTWLTASILSALAGARRMCWPAAISFGQHWLCCQPAQAQTVQASSTSFLPWVGSSRTASCRASPSAAFLPTASRRSRSVSSGSVSVAATPAAWRSSFRRDGRTLRPPHIFSPIPSAPPDQQQASLQTR